MAEVMKRRCFLKMKEGVKQFSVTSIKETALAALGHFAVAVLGFLAARAELIGSFAPFGISFAAGMSSPYIFTAGLGSAAGYFSPVVGGGFRYFSAIFATCTIKHLLRGIGSLEKRPLFSAATAFTTTLGTALATVAGGGITVIMAFAEAFLAAAGGYFFHRFSAAKRGSDAGVSSEQLSCIVISFGIFILGLCPIKIGSLSIGHIVAAVVVLAVARYARAAGGAIAGCAISLFLCLGSSAMPLSALLLSAGGLLSGVFASLGKSASAIAFTMFSAIAVLLSGGESYSFILIAEGALGACIFLLLPKSICIRAGKLFAPPAHIPSLEGLKRSLTMRLYFASRALSDVSETVTEVSSELKLINSPDFDWVLENVKRDGCGGCSLRSFCWDKKETQMRNAVVEMSRLIKAGEKNPSDKINDEFRERCVRPRRVENAVLRYYEEYASRLAAEARIEEIRGVVSDQFEGISDMLFELSEEFDKCESFDCSLATRISSALRENDYHASDIAAKTDKYGRMSIEIRLSMPPAAAVNRMDMLRIVESVCERDFEPPIYNRIKTDVFLLFCERAAFTVNLGVSQLSAGENSVCGDAYTTFSDGKGRYIMLLSDGMGTGGRAAVDGAMASGLMERLLRAGFSYDCALKIVNSSMLFKSSDETLATVDISCIDLYTGAAELLKAGAAPTIIRRSGRTGKAESTSLPAGILREVGFDRASISLKAGDIILMLSDGATASGTEWICAELESYRGVSAQQLAEKIAGGARRRRTDGHDDDITVMAAILEKAV